MNHRKMNRKKLIWIIPAAILGMAIFTLIGGGITMLLWNWLTPTLFGLPAVSFWQAIGLLALCRILFGGFGLGGGHRSNSRRWTGRRMRERWEQMTPEERDRFRETFRGRHGQTTPLDWNPTA
jgi:hypothetical protein